MGRKLEAARDELRRARECVDRMSKAASLGEFDDAWKDCIARLSRFWYKTKASLQGDPRFFNSPHVKEATAAQKNDPLIQYISQARNADEHGIDDITLKAGGSVAINPTEVDGVRVLKNLSLSSGVLRFEAPHGAVISFEPGSVIPQPVRNRNQEYPVPDQHMGKPIMQKSLIEFGSLGVSFYERILNGLDADGWDR